MYLLGYFCMQNSFLHRKTEPKSMVFEKYAKNGKKKYLLSLFSIF